MENIPTIGGKRQTCPLCKRPYEPFDHPMAGRVDAPACNCTRPIHLGDLKLFITTLDEETTAKEAFEAFFGELDARADKERGKK